jgi:hypothetical protein
MESPLSYLLLTEPLPLRLSNATRDVIACVIDTLEANTTFLKIMLGSLCVQCASTGLSASLTFQEGGDVKGSLDAQEPHNNHRGLSQKPRTARIGVLTGNWRGAITVVCPEMVRWLLVHYASNL